MDRPPASTESPEPALFAEPTLRAVTLEDVDRIWDWIRADPRAVDVFSVMRSSLDLHRTFEALLEYQDYGAAYVRSIDVDSLHVGAALVFPILLRERIAVCHLYLHPSRRGRGARHMVRRLLELASADVPGVTLTAVVDRPGLARWLQGFGFRTQYVLTYAVPETPPASSTPTPVPPPAQSDTPEPSSVPPATTEGSHGRPRRKRMAPRTHRRRRQHRRVGSRS